MISINDIVWSEENDNEKIANAIPINCLAYNCTYQPDLAIYSALRMTQGCGIIVESCFTGMHGKNLCKI